MATNAEQAASILIFGHDQSLVQTRQWILQKANFRVHPAMSLSDLDQIAAKESIALFLLCDSLPQETRDRALTLIHLRWPGAKRLVLTPSSLTAEFTSNEEVFSAIEGPRKLVSVIRTLIVNRPATAL